MTLMFNDFQEDSVGNLEERIIHTVSTVNYHKASESLCSTSNTA